MKKEYIIGLLVGCIITTAIFLLPKFLSTTEEFKWSNANRDYETLEKVTFTNGEELIHKRSSDRTFGQSIFLKQDKGKATVFLEDDLVYINSAYPNQSNAQVAIISNVCSGNICSWVPTYMVIQEGNTLKKYLIGSDSINFEAKLNKSGLVDAKANNVVLGEDEFGTDIHGAIEFLPHKGFIVPEMKKYYRGLIGEHPSIFLDNNQARNSLGKLIGADKFRDLRGNLSGPGSSELINYRYLAFTGCMAHNCVDAYGAIVVDTTTDDVWWIKVTDGKFESGGTKIIPKNQVSIYQNIFSKIDFQDNNILSISPAGELITKSRNK